MVETARATKESEKKIVKTNGDRLLPLQYAKRQVPNFRLGTNDPSRPRRAGSLHVSVKMPTYPSPETTFCPKREVGVNVGPGEG